MLPADVEMTAFGGQGQYLWYVGVLQDLGGCAIVLEEALMQ
jgi:hypothetical protein